MAHWGKEGSGALNLKDQDARDRVEAILISLCIASSLSLLATGQPVPYLIMDAFCRLHLHFAL